MTDSGQEPLADFLAEVAGAEHARIESDSTLVGGAIQENRLLVVQFEGGAFDGRQKLVLRRDAPSSVAASHGKSEEFALLKAAFDAGVKVPEPLFLCIEKDLLGSAFYVMRWVPGCAEGRLLTRDPKVVERQEPLAESLGRELAKIHRIVPPRSDLVFLGDPPDHPASQSVEQYRRYLDELEWWDPALEWGLRWCELQAPQCKEIVLLHQDYRTGNYLVEDGELTAILDWEFCAWGDPMSDVGWFCAKCWRFGQEEREAGGIGPRSAFYRGYEAESGRRIDPDAVAYWEVMAHLRWAVIALQQGARHSSGAEESLDLALTGRRAEALAFEVLRMTPPKRWSPLP